MLYMVQKKKLSYRNFGQRPKKIKLHVFMWYVWFLPKWRSEQMHVFFGNYFLLPTWMRCKRKSKTHSAANATEGKAHKRLARTTRQIPLTQTWSRRWKWHHWTGGVKNHVIFFRIIRYVNDIDMEWKIPKDTILSYRIVSLWKPVRERKICIAINRFPVEQLTSKGPKISLLILRFLPFPRC